MLQHPQWSTRTSPLAPPEMQMGKKVLVTLPSMVLTSPALTNWSGHHRPGTTWYIATAGSSVLPTKPMLTPSATSWLYTAACSASTQVLFCE